MPISALFLPLTPAPALPSWGRFFRVDERSFYLHFRDMLSGRQEAALARRLRSCYGGIAHYGEIVPLDFRDVLLSKDPKQQVDLNNAANEVPFLVMASELRDRKPKRRRKFNVPRI